MIDPTLNKSQGKQAFNGYLIKSTYTRLNDTMSIVEIPFKYEVVTSRSYTSTMAGMPIEYTRPTETIRTSQIDLPFVVGDKVRLYDDNIMTVRSVEPLLNEVKAKMGLAKCVEKYTLTLEGGGK